MATYPVINKETGEQKEVRLSVHEWSQWKDDNPEWDRDWSDPSTCPASGEVGDWRDKMSRTHPGFHDIMKNKIAPKAPRNRTITQKYN
ncbi:transcriptional regulator [Synechococcus phage ACG-2014j]|jgi:hypothetical protein|uniref:Uncharacterized protein n=2 Tax=Potamoivirus TaxID=2948872 RepID=A0A1D8KMP0_9CAUD|nr:transcriptional regulator [Synechococcus phage ACG-2014j]YP_009320667.1 transcriptional regulator [Synechococcus phage S-CAM4]YP_010355608.1 transcriptional regulator [Synechococcus phage ACG-2014j]AIX24121.1 hypothetical protein Syn7803US103_226 [Synechococcus phage ACG-2014j]AIX28563.1 hypothetical protein Syn7803US23_219 [Synechococcus phage ACG-2014j]AOV59457.1 hypothetical protein C440309_234 [Synechococcus phage S-CAM4]AOV59695.1 hypothetical protein S330809_234 [Synechococcus phage 